MQFANISISRFTLPVGAAYLQNRDMEPSVGELEFPYEKPNFEWQVKEGGVRCPLSVASRICILWQLGIQQISPHNRRHFSDMIKV